MPGRPGPKPGFVEIRYSLGGIKAAKHDQLASQRITKHHRTGGAWWRGLQLGLGPGRGCTVPQPCVPKKGSIAMPTVVSSKHHQLLGLLVKPHSRPGADGRRNRRLLFGPRGSVKCPGVIEVGRANTAKQHDFLADRVIGHSLAKPRRWRGGWRKLFPVCRRWVGSVGENREHGHKREHGRKSEQTFGDMTPSKHGIRIPLRENLRPPVRAGNASDIVSVRRVCS